MLSFVCFCSGFIKGLGFGLIQYRAWSSDSGGYRTEGLEFGMCLGVGSRGWN